MFALACYPGYSLTRSSQTVTSPFYPLKAKYHSRHTDLAGRLKERKSGNAGKTAGPRLLESESPNIHSRSDGAFCSIGTDVHAIPRKQAKLKVQRGYCPLRSVVNVVYASSEGRSSAGDQPTDVSTPILARVKACVAGAGTPLGFTIVSRLASLGVPVRALIDCTTEVIPNDELQWTPDVGSLLSKEPGVNIVEVDLRQVDLDISRPENLRKVFGDSNTLIIALGKRPSLNVYEERIFDSAARLWNPSEIDPDIIQETRLLVEGAKLFGITKTVLLSALPVNKPIEVYSEADTANMGEPFVINSGLDYTIIRPGVLCYSLPDTSTLRGRVGDLTVDIRAPGTLCLEKETYTMQKVWSAFGPDPPNFRWVLFDEVAEWVVKSIVSPIASNQVCEVEQGRVVDMQRFRPPSS